MCLQVKPNALCLTKRLGFAQVSLSQLFEMQSELCVKTLSPWKHLTRFPMLGLGG